MSQMVAAKLLRDMLDRIQALVAELEQIPGVTVTGTLSIRRIQALVAELEQIPGVTVTGTLSIRLHVDDVEAPANADEARQLAFWFLEPRGPDEPPTSPPASAP